MSEKSILALRGLTSKQLERVYGQAYERMVRLFEGGTQYGIDWPTVCMVAPAWAAVLRALVAEDMERKRLAWVAENEQVQALQTA